MTVINPALVPMIAPGNVFTALSGGDATLSVRWFTSQDPVMYSVLNRPIADTVLRQLIIAKTLDTLSTSIGHQAIFPFLVSAKVYSATTEVDIPTGWIWDLHMSTPAKWENFRLAKIKRVAGINGANYTGIIRLIFTANQLGSTAVEVALFSAEFQLDSELTYQRARLTVVDSIEESIVIDPGEAETIDGFITFRTLDQDDPIVQSFYNLLVPPTNTADSNGDGYYDSPTSYDISDTVSGGTGVANDYSTGIVIHGTGLLVDSCNNSIPQMDSDVQSWINAFNFPFDTAANRRSTGSSGITIPIGLFREFDIAAPAGDQPANDTTGLQYPVWVSKIEMVGTQNDQLRFYFSTYNVTDTAPSLQPVEFARMDLLRTMTSGQIVAITPVDNLKLQTGSDSDLFNQHFGRGHVVLSSLWGGTSSIVDDFFDAFALVVDGEIDFTLSSTRVGSFAISRTPKYTPTMGQNQAMEGSTSRRIVPIPPSVDNLFVTEQDQGLGDAVDLESGTNINPYNGIDRYGYTGSLCHRIIRLCVDGTKLPTGTDVNAATFYNDEILPRLILLLGRAPQYGDYWYDGTRLFFNSGDQWQSS